MNALEPLNTVVPVHSFPEEEDIITAAQSLPPLPKEKRKRAKVSWGWKEVVMEEGIYVCKTCKIPFPRLGTIHCTISNVKSHIKRSHSLIFESYCTKHTDPTDPNCKLLEWVYRRNHPFSIVDQSELISLLKFIPASRTTLVENYSKRIYTSYLFQVNIPSLCI